jgi:AcrR family transcriptional regulator
MGAMGDEPQRTDPRVDRTRIAVLSAVRELINEAGWDAVTHVRVAERSAVGRTTIYRHWPERVSLVREAYELELDITRDVELTGELRADLLAVLEAIRFELSERGGTHILTALISRSEFDDDVRDLKQALVNDALQVLRKVLSKAISGKHLSRGMTADKAISELVGPMLMDMLVLDTPVPPKRVIELVDTFISAHSALQG